MEQQIRDIIRSIEIKLSPFGVETNGENAVQQLLQLFCQTHVSSSKELCVLLLNKELEWMKNDKTPFAHGETLEQERHLDNKIALERVIKLIDAQ